MVKKIVKAIRAVALVCFILAALLPLGAFSPTAAAPYGTTPPGDVTGSAAALDPTPALSISPAAGAIPDPGVSPPPEVSPSPDPGVSPPPEVSLSPDPGVSPLPDVGPSPDPGVSPSPDVSPNPDPGVSPPLDVSPSPDPGISPPPDVSPGPDPTAPAIPDVPSGPNGPADPGASPGPDANSPVNPDNSASPEVTPAPGDLSDQTFTAAVYTDATQTVLTSDEAVQVQGALPAGGYAVAYPVELPQDAGNVLVAYDITVYTADGTKFEFDGSLTVSITIPDMPAGLSDADLSLMYVPADGTPETLDTPVSVTDTGVSFDVQHFSTYAIVMSSVTAATLNGASLTLTQNGTDYSCTIPDTLAAGSAGNITVTVNSNLTITSMTVNDIPSSGFTTAAGGKAGAVSYGMNTKIVLVCYRTTQKDYCTVTINIKVSTPLQISDTILTNGQLNPVWTGSGTVTGYTWQKSKTGAAGSYTPASSQAISLDGKSVNVGLDNGAMLFYEVTATVDNGDGTTSQITSAPYQVPYAAAIQNGDFEPAPGASLNAPTGTNASVFYNFSNGAVGLYWRTTAQDFQTEIAHAYPNYHLQSADHGTRFAELNANFEGTLYQDVLVTPGEVLSWSLAHAGRNGPDTMQVVIMPTNMVDLANIPTASVVDPVTGHNIVDVTTITDGTTGAAVTNNTQKWGHYSSTSGGKTAISNAAYTVVAPDYVVPAGVYVVRFYFVSMSAQGGNKTIGNLLDSVTFSIKPITYTIEYYLNGTLTAAVPSDVDMSDTSTWNSAPPGTLIDAAAVDQATFDIYKAYTFQKSQIGYNGDGGPFKSLKGATDFTLTMDGSILRLYYVSSGLIVNKTVEGVPAKAVPGDYTVTFDLYENGVADKVASAVVPVSASDGDTVIDGSLQFMAPADDTHPAPYAFPLKAGVAYTLVEVLSDPDPITGYACTDTASTMTSNDPATPANFYTSAGASVTFTAGSSDGIYEAYFTNTYEPTTVPFSFTKVGADGTTPLTGVKFTLYPLLPPDPGVEGSTEQPDMANPITAISADGSDSTIPAGFVDFGGLKSGDYQLVETQTVPGYALPAGSWKITINAAATGVGADQSVKIIVFEGMPMAFMETKTIREDGTTATALAVRNYLQQVLPITGGIGSIPFVISGVGLIGVSIILSFSIKDKKNKRSRA